jgi:hypothetical protein
MQPYFFPYAGYFRLFAVFANSGMYFAQQGEVSRNSTMHKHILQQV